MPFYTSNSDKADKTLIPVLYKEKLVRSVDTIANLRALTDYSDGQRINVAGYYSAGDGADFPPFKFDASSSATDNGGTIIKPNNISSGPGRWLLECNPAELNVAWFGAINTLSPASDVLVNIQAAHDALPIIYGVGSGPGGAYVTPSGRLFRQGKLHFPRWRYYIGGSFYRSPVVDLIGEGALNNGTIIQLIAGTFTDYNDPHYMIVVDVGEGGDTGGGDISGNNCFFNHMEGFAIHGDAQNGNDGVMGFSQFTAQGTVVRDLCIFDMGPMGFATSGLIDNVWVANTRRGPGLIFRGGVIVRACVEHCNTEEVTDGLGLLPQVLINATDEVSIGTLQGELSATNANGTMLRINDAWHGANIDNVYWGGSAAGAVITVDIVGQSRRVTIGSMDYNGSAGSFILLRDRSENSPLGSGVPYTLDSGPRGYSQVWPTIEDIAGIQQSAPQVLLSGSRISDAPKLHIVGLADNYDWSLLRHVYLVSYASYDTADSAQAGGSLWLTVTKTLHKPYVVQWHHLTGSGIVPEVISTTSDNLDIEIHFKTFDALTGDNQVAYKLELISNVSEIPEFTNPTAINTFTYEVLDETDTVVLDSNYGAVSPYATIADIETAKTSPVAIVTESTTARTLGLSDIGKYIRLTNASACTITLPTNSSVDWAAQIYPPRIDIRVAAAGIPTLSAAGVTINDPQSIIAGLATGDNFSIQWVATNEWDVIG